MTFSDDMARFQAKTEAKLQALHQGVVSVVFASIVEGSPVTGAPGQPVDTGNLRSSWINTPEAPTVNLISTNVAYAPMIEDGGPSRAGKPLTLRSKVGGFHSVKLTRAAWQRIVDYVAQRMAQ